MVDSALELMRENMALNEPRQHLDETEDADGADREGPSGSVTLSAKTLDWDAPLPDWVTTDHPHVVM